MSEIVPGGEPIAAPGGETHAPGARGPAGTIPLAVPNIGALERDYVLRAVESGFVSSVGPFVGEFEETFARRVGARYAVACSTGTAALHVALRVLGVRPGDDVLCSDFTFVGSVNPIAYQGDPGVRRLGAVHLEPRPRAGGRRARTSTCREGGPAGRCRGGARARPAGRPGPGARGRDRFGVPVVEDAAESLGAGWSAGPLAGRQTGTVGRVGAFSFNGNKIATTGGGGMLVTDDEALARRARHLTTQAKVPDVGYLHDEVGYNYRLTNIAAALGLAQLERLDDFIAHKHRIAARYDEALAATGLVLPPRVPGLDATYWLYSVLTPAADERGRDGLLAHLASRGVGARALWRPLHVQPPFAGVLVLGSDGVASDLFHRGVSLPCATELTHEDQGRVIDAVLEYYA